MRILIAPNAFKHTLSASQAAQAMAAGLRASRLEGSCTLFPVGDGGDGTAELLVDRWQGQWKTVEAEDPLGRPRMSRWGWVPDSRTAVIELASASGLQLLTAAERDPLRAHTRGTGRLLQAAMREDPERIVLCIGGSATVDGATGLLRVLGYRFLDARGRELEALPEKLENLEQVDEGDVDPALWDREWTILCDVQNPLLGPEGAASVFGPQKGASPAQVEQLEKGLNTLCRVLERQGFPNPQNWKMGGAAGGVAALLACLGKATLVPGIEWFLDETPFSKALSAADLVMTGEGKLDNQTLQGKAPWGVARRAKERGLPVIALCGQVPKDPEPELRKMFDVMLSIHPYDLNLSQALELSAQNLRRTAREIGELLALSNGRTDALPHKS